MRFMLSVHVLLYLVGKGGIGFDSGDDFERITAQTLWFDHPDNGFWTSKLLQLRRQLQSIRWQE